VSERLLTPADLASVANPFAFMVSRYARRPYHFVVEVLGATPDPWQYEALMALQRGHNRISIRSGHGVGKTTFLSWILLWHILCAAAL
jgi:phage terminase large subunit